jgi:hypothetical protein
MISAFISGTVHQRAVVGYFVVPVATALDCITVTSPLPQWWNVRLLLTLIVLLAELSGGGARAPEGHWAGLAPGRHRPNGNGWRPK